MINELLAKIYLQVKDVFAQVYYPVFERQYIDPLKFKEKPKGLVSFKSGDNETAMMLVMSIAGMIIFVLLIVLTYNYFQKKKKNRNRLKLK